MLIAVFVFPPWQACQSEMSADAFGKLIVNFSHKEARFDSRSEPLVRLFRLLPIVIETLRKLSEDADDDADRRYAKALLRSFGGPVGYDLLVSAALTADAMLVLGKYINLSQVSADDAALEGEESARMLHEVRVLFRDGGIWLPEAEGTLTHCVLGAIRGKVVFHGKPNGKREAIFLGWPAPGSRERRKPMERAKQIAELIEAFHDSNFPNFEVGKLWSAFNLQSGLTTSERSSMIRQLCARYSKNFEAVQRALFGVSEDFTSGSVWTRGRYYACGGGLQVRRSKYAADVGPRFPNRPVQDGKIVHGEPHRLGIALPASGNVAAWLCVLDDLHKATRDPKQAGNKAAYADLVSLLERYVCRLTSTGDVERWFGKIALIELKQRAHTGTPDLVCLPEVATAGSGRYSSR